MRIHRDGADDALLRRGGTRSVRSGSGPARSRVRYASEHARVQRGGIAKSFLGANKHGARQSQRDTSLMRTKSWITSASHATAYVWSSRPLAAEGLRRYGSCRQSATGLASRTGRSRVWACAATIHRLSPPPESPYRTSAMLGSDGQGFEIMMGVVLPGIRGPERRLFEWTHGRGLRRTVEHATRTQHSDTGRNAGRSATDPKLHRAHAGRRQTCQCVARGHSGGNG